MLIANQTAKGNEGDNRHRCQQDTALLLSVFRYTTGVAVLLNVANYGGAPTGQGTAAQSGFRNRCSALALCQR